MAIEEMVLLNMTFDCHDLDQVLFKLKDSKCFYPQPASKIVNNVKGVQALYEGNVYTKLLDELIQVASDLKLELHSELTSVDSLNQEKTYSYLKELAMEVKKIKDVQNQLIEEKNENEKTLEILNCLSLSEVDLDQLMECHYIKTKFGRFPKENFDRIAYYEGKPFIFNKLGEDRNYVWCCYIVTKDLQLNVDNIFKSIGFEEIGIPSFVHGNLKAAKQELENEIHAMTEYILRTEQQLTILRETHKVDLLILYSTILFLERVEEFKIFVVDFQSKCAIYGFIPKRKIDEFKDNFKDLKNIHYKKLPVDILEHQDVVAPTVVHNSKLVRPFESISKVKQVDVIDTTIAFAVLYYAVFMIFFGDLGVGVILTLLGLLMRKKNNGQLLFLLGIATLLGGIVCGHAFYTIQLYSAITLPLSPVYKLVDGIVLLGVGSYTINVFKKMYLENSTLERILSLKGVCGLIIIYALLTYVGCVVEAHLSIPIMPFAIIIVACFVLILAKSIVKKRLAH